MTIEEFLESNIMKYVNEKLAYLADDIKQSVVDRILKKKEISVYLK